MSKPLDIDVRPSTDLEEYARIPIAFEVRSVLDLRVRSRGLGGIELVEREIRPTYVKDYDAHGDASPTAWSERFDLSSWRLLSARAEGEPVGAAAVAWRARELTMLEGRSDLALLWDLRIAPAARRRGVGAALFAAACDWARSLGCRWLEVETQNVNVPACRFYASRGCTLGAIHRFAYPELPEEAQLRWYKDLALPVSRT